MHSNIITNTLAKFKGVQTLYNYDTQSKSLLLKNLGYLEELHELNKWQDELNRHAPFFERDHLSRSWENISYGNDICDSFMFGDELPTDENDHKFSYTLFLPNSEWDDSEQEQCNKLYFVKKDIDEKVVLEMFFDNMSDFITFWKVCRRNLVDNW